QKRLSESRSPMFTNAYFAEDAQSADPNGVTFTSPPACGSGTNVVSFAWNENGTPFSSSYVLGPDSSGSTVLKRNYCMNGTPHTIIVAPVLGANGSCGQPACASATNDPGTSRPRTITLTATTPNGENNFFTLQATRRAT